MYLGDDLRKDMMRRYAAEAIGTFGIVFAPVALSGAHLLRGADGSVMAAALVSGLAVLAMIYALGHISAAHFNPAVSLGFAVAGRFPWRFVIPYWISQFSGAILAACMAALLFGAGHGVHIPAVPALQAVGIELMLTFLLMLVIIAVATDRRANGAVPGLAIGCTVVFDILIGGAATGGSMNPARTLGPALFGGAGALSHYWIYMVGPCLGAVAAAQLYEMIRGGEEHAIGAPNDLYLALKDIEISAMPVETPIRKDEQSMEKPPHINRPRMILVGGFLGAGKTTLLARASGRLLEQGKRVGLITNDQAADLVDTTFLRQSGQFVREIAGGCFCCRFGQLIETAAQIVAEISPDVIIGEPVGSCTDLAATVLQPIKDLYADAYDLAPLSVLVDPVRLRDVIEPGRLSAMHPSALYILRKQLEEADIIVINKRDLLDAQERRDLEAQTRVAFPGKAVCGISALTGDGVDEWLEALSRSEEAAGARIVDVDYDIYAEGEAVLGWLNASATLKSMRATDWKTFALKVLERIQRTASDRGAEIAHVKLILTSSTGQYIANLTSTAGIPAIRGTMEGVPSDVSLVINARVQMSPDALQGIVEDVLHANVGDKVALQMDTMRSLSPGRPVPTHRYASLI